MTKKRKLKRRIWIRALQRAAFRVIDHPDDAAGNGMFLFRVWCTAVVRSLRSQRTIQAKRQLELWFQCPTHERKKIRVDNRSFVEFVGYVNFAAGRFSALMAGAQFSNHLPEREQFKC